MDSTSTYQGSTALQANNTDMSVKDWMITLFIMFIPLVNIIMLFVWAFGGDVSKPSRANWAKAGLIWALIMLVLYFVVFVTFFGAIMSAASSSL